MPLSLINKVLTARSARAAMLAGLLFSGAALAQAEFPAAEMDPVFADFGDETPGCAVGVISAGALVFARGYGMASLELRIGFSDPIPLTVHLDGTASFLRVKASAGKLDDRVEEIELDAGRVRGISYRRRN